MANNDAEFVHSMNVGLTTERAAAVVVFACLTFLIMVRRGFRGVSVGGLSVGVK